MEISKVCSSKSFMSCSDGRIVSVSFNYRLNAFGYLALDVLSSNDPRGSSGKLRRFISFTDVIPVMDC